MSYMPRAERRQAILEATLKLATENGFAGLTARAIARELDAATGIVHHHFESLEDLKCAAFRYANENGFHKHLEKARSMPPRDGIQFILASYPEHGEEFEIRIWMSAGDESLRSEQMQQAFTECYNSTQQVLTDIIEAGRIQKARSRLVYPPRKPHGNYWGSPSHSWMYPISKAPTWTDKLHWKSSPVKLTRRSGLSAPSKAIRLSAKSGI